MFSFLSNVTLTGLASFTITCIPISCICCMLSFVTDDESNYKGLLLIVPVINLILFLIVIL